MQTPITTIINNITSANCRSEGYFFRSKFPNSVLNASVSITVKQNGANVSQVFVDALCGLDDMGGAIWVRSYSSKDFSGFNVPTPYTLVKDLTMGSSGLAVGGLPNLVTASLLVTEYIQPIRISGFGI